MSRAGGFFVLQTPVEQLSSKKLPFKTVLPLEFHTLYVKKKNNLHV
jgi:hypothetical protein